MNNDQFVRYKALDRCFRNPYGSYTIVDLIEECSKAVGMFHGDMTRRVARRTVEKDIEDLRLRYDIRFCENSRIGHKKVYRYDDVSFSLMQKLLADGVLEQMMLQNVLDTLSCYDDMPQYKWLYMFIQQRLHGLKAEATSAIAFQHNPDLLGMHHFDVLLNAILKQHPIEVEYRKYYGESRIYRVHPYMLKQYNDRWFLICRSDGYDNLSNFPIDRIQCVSPIEIPFQPVGFDLIEYFEDIVGVTRDVRRPIEDVVIRVKHSRFPYIESKPLHPSQTTLRTLCSDDFDVVKFHVQINNELEAKILSLGNDVEVLSPASLRESIAERIKELYTLYVANNDIGVTE